jgi:hypothetical protein
LLGSPIWDPEFNGKTPAHVIAAAQAAQAIEAGAGIVILKLEIAVFHNLLYSVF